MGKVSNRLIEIFLQLVEIDAVSGKEKPVAGFISAFLANLGLTTVEDGAAELSGGNSGNLICKVGSGGGLALLAHMDTARPTADLKAKVLSDRIVSEGGTILGADNRAGVALILYTIENHAQGNGRFSDFTAVFTVCEETSMAGSRFVNLPPYIKGAYAIDTSLRPGNFINRTYGSRSFSIDVHGKAAHSGLAPEQGVNSIKIASEAINSLTSGRINDELIVNIAQITGGEATNVVPANTTVSGEIRGLTKQLVDSAWDEIQKQFELAAGNYSGQVNCSSEWSFVPYQVDDNNPVYLKLEKAISKTGLKPVSHLSPGGSDANSLNEKGIPTINVGIGAQKPHSDDEFILLEDLDSASKIIANLLIK